MVGVADIKRLAAPPAQKHDANQVRQRNGEHQQRFQHGPRVRVLPRVKVRQNCHYREQVADQMAAGVAQKRAGLRKIVRQETQQRAARPERPSAPRDIDRRNGGDRGEIPCADGAQSGAQSVHVVHEIERVDDGEHPQNCDGVTEHNAGHEQRDAYACRGDEHGNEQLAA